MVNHKMYAVDEKHAIDELFPGYPELEGMKRRVRARFPSLTLAQTLRAKSEDELNSLIKERTKHGTMKTHGDVTLIGENYYQGISMTEDTRKELIEVITKSFNDLNENSK